MKFFTSSRSQCHNALDRLPLFFSISLMTLLIFPAWARQSGDADQDHINANNFHTSVIDNKFVLADWKIAHPNALELYTVERSTDGVNFETAGYVHGEFSNTPEINYSFIDENPYNGISYYRVKTVHSNKQTTYSPVMSVLMSKLKFMVYPNPVKHNESVNLNIENGKGGEVVVQMFDMNGKRVMNKSLQLNEGRNLLQLPLSETAAGMYTLTISSESFFEKHMLNVQ